ncbi:hypothetical protein SAMN06265338_102572 [Rhodoblastus acidophilus]|uniref:Methionyl-tRNA formyltransferase n=1 Tax=Rhodoblastus acidophilus TaxID=1074 RepID=A0A212R4G8_RHOAC|nr:methionyl-tRNA formyltransferase [Rhodoblastus acidophilus]PPQ36547.1 hypothetical protein CKO16_17550 [Rhodoblastus acidophilus]RAI16337.1 hypothetical protein CH337_21940 [Rhodoblastus acidophilus]SNB66974.1 hypothetical protein SAMN06265338_102572 [Rhodoblastus acidophilus]
MVLIKTFVREDLTTRAQDAVDASYTVFDRDGAMFVQFNTCGSLSRKIPGKTSQTFQLDESSARELFDILKNTFKL